ncbi:MAG: DoxX family protein [Candidatus Peribacteraceae bacterium]|nr:DoxX family protein [Candidatus Peribacteraceae bacterium]
MTTPLFSRITHAGGQPLYLLFRILVGFLFLQHGLQKLGMLDGGFQVNGFMGFIGLCELAGGLAIFFGIWTRLVAVLGTALLIGAYTTVHMGNGLLPIQNRGELALLYVAAFVALFLYGAGAWSLERLLTKREFF